MAVTDRSGRIMDNPAIGSGAAADPEPAAENARLLDIELEWFLQVLDTRISLYFERPSEVSSIHALSPPDLAPYAPSEYARLVRTCGFGFDERIVLLLALIPHLRPALLDTFFIQNKNFDRGFTEFGGWKGQGHSGFLPTCETAAFIIAGNDLEKRFELTRLFEDDHVFLRERILQIEHPGNGEPRFSSALRVGTDTLNRLTHGRVHKPDYSIDFPARRISTPLDWEDLVLADEVMDEIETLNAWFRHSGRILHEWGFSRSIKPGYRCLFYGPPGTGKTLSATLLGAANGVDVYRIDLSMVVSKYIGETEKNLAGVFDQAENKNWILFFDEADALFGKRTQASSSNDRYANQEVSYLLQRIEEFPGIVILATNLKANIDEAFARRFQSIVYFPVPDAEQRNRLWQSVFRPESLHPEVDLAALSERFELTGGAITNVARYAAIRALQAGREKIHSEDLVQGVKRELRKEGKTF